MYEDNYYGQAPVNPRPNTEGKAKIRVIGVGGAGNNAVNRMIDAGIMSAEYIVVNTDAQTLALSKAQNRIQIGRELTKGLGAGADPEIGRAAAEESEAELAAAIEGTDLLFITTGMGGGTGTGAAPVIAKIAKDKKILTAAVVTKPFDFEGKRRMDNAVKGIENLRKFVDTLIIIPNEKISEVVPKNASFPDALRVADEVLKQGIRGIADLIVTPALINLDFADVRTVLKDRGLAHMGVGVSKGENRIVEAVRLAVNSPLLETTIEGATGVILNVVGGNDLTLDEVRTAAKLIHSVVDYSANIIFGACIDPKIRDEVEVTVIATGFPDTEEELNKPETASRTQMPLQFPGQPNMRPQQAVRGDDQPLPYTQRPYYMPPQRPVVPPQSAAQPSQYAAQQPYVPNYGQPVTPQPAPVNETYHAADDFEAEEDDTNESGYASDESNLPPFVRRMLRKKK
ncbi:MAG: cell division protein FtsZ [Clostridia bacterium]|nr:cell division protein FtsZ [Clostridia bacterium]